MLFKARSVLPIICGGGEIRTHGTLSDTTVFKTVAFNHSATPPFGYLTLFLGFFQFLPF